MPQPDPQRMILDNGITVIVVENNTADIIASRFFFKAGSREEAMDKAGLAHLLATVITKGTEQLTSAEIAAKIESMGASLGADATSDYFLVSCKTVARDFAEILPLVAEVIQWPTFPPEEVELEQYLTLQNIRAQKERPFNLAFQQLARTMYPGHPYGNSVLGTEETVTSLTREDLQVYHQTYFRPDNLIISLSGRITPIEVVELLDRTFGSWSVPKIPIPTPIAPPIIANPQTQKIYQDTQQAIIMLGYLAPSVHKEDYMTLKLLNTYLGNGLSSRLFVELREKRGLAYDVSAFYPTRSDRSQFVAYLGTAPDNTSIALDGLQQEIERLCQHLLSPEEIQAAKNKLLGQYALGKQTNGEIAQIFGWYETIGVGLQFDTHFQETITHITPEQCLTVASRYFESSPYISLVGPETILVDF